MKSRTKPALRVVPAATVQLTLPVQGVLKDAQSAFYGLCIQAGKLAAMMEADRVALCGPSGVPDTKRRAVRGGSTRSAVVLGGQRIAVQQPRARSVDAGELELPTFAWAAASDPLDSATMAAVAAGAPAHMRAFSFPKLTGIQWRGSGEQLSPRSKVSAGFAKRRCGVDTAVMAFVLEPASE